MLNKLIFNNKIYTFSDKDLKDIYRCMLINETKDESEAKYVLSFITNSVILKRYEDLVLHEFIIDGSFRVSNLVCNIANVFGGARANKYALRLSEDLSYDFPAIKMDYIEAIDASDASDIWMDIFGEDGEYEKFKSLLVLLTLYRMTEFDYEQQCKDTKEIREKTFFNGVGVKQIDFSGKDLLKPLFGLYDTPFEQYIEIAGIWVPPTLLSIIFKTVINSKIAGTFNELLMESMFRFKYEQLSGKTIKLIDREDYSQWGNDPKIFGRWYVIHKSTHPVLGIDYSLTIVSYNEDGTAFNHIQIGVKNLNFSKDFRWSKYVSKWKTNNDEIIIVNGDLDSKHRYKYEIKNDQLIIGKNNYYRTYEEALEAIKK